MFKKFQKGGKFAYEMLVPTVKKNLTKRRKDFEDLVKTTDKYTKNLTGEGRIKVKEAVQPAAKKISGIHDKYEKKLGPGSSNPKNVENKAKGGRVGLKRGTGLMKKKSNVEKIKETFSPKNKSTKFGMLSVKAGIDKNPNPTQADRIAGAKMKNRMKAAFGGGADMGKVASDKTKTEVKKYEKRAKDASKFLKNKGRSFGSIMREKYMR